jgi:hypothetical protein
MVKSSPFLRHPGSKGFTTPSWGRRRLIVPCPAGGKQRYGGTAFLAGLGF